MAFNDPACSKRAHSASRPGRGRRRLSESGPSSQLTVNVPPVPSISASAIQASGAGVHRPFHDHSLSPMPSPLIFPSTFNLPQDFTISSGQSTPSLAPSDSISQIHIADSQLGSGLHPSRGSHHVLSRQGSRMNIDNSQYMLWTPEKQQSFENRLGRLTASAGLPFSWVDNPEWLAFVDEFTPAAQSPGRQTLSRRIIPKLVKELRGQVKNEVCGQNATIQADSDWHG